MAQEGFDVTSIFINRNKEINDARRNEINEESIRSSGKN
jgi:hypothetical protein